MQRRNCTNCQTSWSSLADHELDSPHTCPQCGDELGPIGHTQPELERALAGFSPS